MNIASQLPRFFVTEHKCIYGSTWKWTRTLCFPRSTVWEPQHFSVALLSMKFPQCSYNFLSCVTNTMASPASCSLTTFFCASLSRGRTAAAQCGLFTKKSVPVIFESHCTCLVLEAVAGDSVFGVQRFVDC